MTLIERPGLLVLAAALLVPLSSGQTPPAPLQPNSDPTYQQLRNIGLTGESFSVNDLDLKKDAATFHLHSGSVCFVPPVQGKVTGAVFVGNGTMTLDPPSDSERRSLKLLTSSDEFVESFQHLVVRFTDSTYQEIAKAGAPSHGACDVGLLRDSQNVMRHQFHYNLDARILEDVLSPDPGGLFVAFVHGKHYNGKILFSVDPNGSPVAPPDEVSLMTYDENKFGVWAAFRLSSEYRAKLGPGAYVTSAFHIEHQELDSAIEGSGHLEGKAQTAFVSRSQNLRVVPFNLYGSLRVQTVANRDGQPLSFIQEDRHDDPDFYVLLPKALHQGDEFSIITKYGGKDAVLNTGNGNYYVSGGARDSWYPGNALVGLGDYTVFDMIFRIPKGMKMAASGSLISEKEENGKSVTVWRSDIAQPLAGFQFGRMKVEEAKLSSPDFLVATYANDSPPDEYMRFQGGTMGTLSTVSMMKNPLSEAQFAIKLYTDYFGPLPFKRLSLTQQTACTYGQSWPDLVWLPICSFFDITVRHQLGLDWADNGYWNVVTPHEVAHQWWGQLVGFNSYRDQWMSEGFADFSASLFLQNAYGPKSPKMHANFWNDERKLILEKNQFGFRAIDVGPLTMGGRLDNSKAGFNIYRHLIYPKGAFILHMIRMMMWSAQTGDQNFKQTMQDFVKTYGGKAATTEDFKSIVEKHMTPDMNAAGDHKMDWFFDEYVYGTALPGYDFVPIFDKGPTGDVLLTYKLTQSGVDDTFVMMVPVYLQFADGRVFFLGRLRVKGNTTVSGKASLKGLKDLPKSALINVHNDVLSSN
jgi:peptidase M1-like protein